MSLQILTKTKQKKSYDSLDRFQEPLKYKGTNTLRSV